MGPRLRFTDAFALVGIVVLLVSVPAYVAQDEAGDDLTAGWEGTFPKPRDGAYMEVEMVATWAGQEPLVVGPVWTHEIRAVTPGEVPVDATFVYQRDRHPMTVDLGWGTYRTDHYSEWTYYDDQGRLVWTTKKVPEGSLLEPTDRVVVSDQRATGSGTDLNHWAGVPLSYHPDIGRLAFESVKTDLLMQIDWAFFDGGPPRFHTLDQVHEHRDQRLFRLGFDAVTVLTGDDRPCAGCHSHPMEILPLKIKDGHGPSRMLRADAFEWVSLDWPVPVGPHVWYYDANATEIHLEVAFVPKVIRPGTGTPFAVEPQGRWERAGRDHEIPVADAVALPTMRLGALQHDVRALHRDVTIPDLLAAVRGDEAPDQVRRFAEEAHLVEFYWVDGVPYERATSSETPALPVDLPGDPHGEVTTVLPMTWFVSLAHDNGTYRIFQIDLERSALGIEVQQVADLCEVQQRSLHWALTFATCMSVSPDLVEASRMVADPLAARDRAAEQAGVPAERLPSFGYLPLAHTAQEQVGGLFTVQHRSAIYPQHANLPSLPPEWGHEQSGNTFWRTNESDGAYTTSATGLMDGGTYSRTVFRAASADERAPETQQEASAAVDVMRPLDVIGKTALTGGLLLIGLSLAARALAWFKAGGSLPLLAVLYAKITRSEVLSNGRRNEIMELVRNDPGVTASDIARQMRYGWGATVHHLETLVKNGFLTPVQMHGKRHYFTTDEGSRFSRRTGAARRDASAAGFLDAVAAHPGVTLKELTELLDRGSSALSRTGTRLAREGLLRKRRDGMNIRFWPAEPAEAAHGTTALEQSEATG